MHSKQRERLDDITGASCSTSARTRAGLLPRALCSRNALPPSLPRPPIAWHGGTTQNGTFQRACILAITTGFIEQCSADSPAPPELDWALRPTRPSRGYHRHGHTTGSGSSSCCAYCAYDRILTQVVRLSRRVHLVPTPRPRSHDLTVRARRTPICGPISDLDL